jgi:hypothetical protein
MTVESDKYIKASIQEGVLILGVGGLADLDVLRTVRAEIFRAAVSNEIQRVLVDLSKSVLLMTSRRWSCWAMRRLPSTA